MNWDKIAKSLTNKSRECTAYDKPFIHTIQESEMHILRSPSTHTALTLFESPVEFGRLYAHAMFLVMFGSLLEKLAVTVGISPREDALQIPLD
jgi:hypothetical protein